MGRGVAETDIVEVVCDAAVLGPYLVGVGLSEDGTHHGSAWSVAEVRQFRHLPPVRLS